MSRTGLRLYSFMHNWDSWDRFKHQKAVVVLGTVVLVTMQSVLPTSFILIHLFFSKVLLNKTYSIFLKLVQISLLFIVSLLSIIAKVVIAN